LPREKAYLIYPFAVYGTPQAEKFKASLAERYDVVDPFEAVGVGTDPEIAERDMQLIDGCDRVIAFLPCEGLQSGWELCYAFTKRKNITIHIKPSLVGPFINWMEKNGVEINFLWQEKE